MRLGTPKIKQKYHRGTTNVSKRTVTDENTFLVFPFALTMGYVNSTQAGLGQDNTKVFEASTFNRIFTGLENMIAQWEDAYSVYKNEDTDTFLMKSFKPGRSLKAFIPSENMATTFEPSPISNDFLQQTTQEDITIRTQDEFTQEDLFKLFVIPELNVNKFLYVSAATRHFDSGKNYVYTEVTLTTLNSTLSKTGRAVEEFIQFGAPGEGYAYPSVNTVEGNKIVTINDRKSRDVPITSMQVEIAGPAAFSTLFAYGRPTIQEEVNGVITTKFNPKIEAPRKLLPLILETPLPSPVNTRPAAETDWFILKDAQPTLEENLSDWKKQFEQSWDKTQQSQYEGTLITGQKVSEVEATNPIVGGSREHILWDSNWKVNIKKTLNTEPDRFTGANIPLDGDYTIPELLCHNIFATSFISSLPMTLQQNIAWNNKDIPIIGGFLNKLSLGVPWGWVDKNVRIQMDKLLLLVPASTVLYGQALLDPENKVEQDHNLKIGLDIWTGQNESENIKFSGINATGSIIKVQLTHRFKKTIDGVEYTFDTKDEGQAHPTIDDEGVAIPGTLPEKLLWDETCKPTGRGDTPGYVIDVAINKALAKLEYRLAFFEYNEPVWTGSYQSNSLFTGNIRDWNNEIKMSNWKSTRGTIGYPGYVDGPNPPGVNYPLVSIGELLGKELKTEFPEIEAKDRTNRAVILPNPKFATVGIGIPLTYIDSDEQDKYWIRSYKNKELDEFSATFDTTAIGGINVIKNNYRQIRMTISIYNNLINTQRNLIFDTNKLVVAGEKEYIEEYIQSPNKTISKYIAEDNLIMNISVKLITNIKVQGDKLIFNIKMFADFIWKDKDGNKVPNGTTYDLNLDFFKNSDNIGIQTIKVASAFIQPKPI